MYMVIDYLPQLFVRGFKIGPEDLEIKRSILGYEGEERVQHDAYHMYEHRY